MKTKLIITLLLITTTAFAEPFTVGVSIPMTGDLSEYGKAVQNGFQMVALQPKKIKVVYEDNQYSSAKAITAFERLRTNHKPDLLYQWGENVLAATTPLVERYKIPTLALSVDARPAVGKKFIIRTINSHLDWAYEILTYLRTNNFKKIGILTVEDLFMNSLMEGINKELKSDEEVKLIGILPETENNFNSIITSLKNKHFDSVGVLLYPSQASSFFRQAKALNIILNTFGTDTFDSETVINDAKGGMEGTVFPLIPVPTEFAVEYRSKFGNDIQLSYAYNAYLMAKLIAVKFGDITSKLSAEEVVKRLTMIENQPYVFTNTKLEGMFYKFPMIMKRVSGKTTTVARASADQSL